MNGVRLRNKHQVFGKLGTFWFKNTTAESRELARTLSHVGDACDAPQELWRMASMALGEATSTEVGRVLRWGVPDLLIIGPDVQRRVLVDVNITGPGSVYVARRPLTYEPEYDHLWPATDETGYGGLLSTELGEYIFFPESSGASTSSALLTFDCLQTRYGLPVPMDFRPVALHTITGRTLLTGLDFLAGEGVLIFFEDPRTLFPDNECVATGVAINPTPWDFVLGVDDVPAPYHITQYYKNHVTVRALEKAAAEAGGLVVVEADTDIQHVTPTARGGALYHTTGGLIRVPYPHTLLAAQTHLTAGAIIGQGLKLFSGTAASPWWRVPELSWENGLSLDTLCPFKGLVAPDGISTATAVLDDITGRLHVRFELTGPADKLNGFWAMTARNETITGRYLNDVFGFESDSDTAPVNVVDFYFQHLLGARAIVVKIGADVLPRSRARILNFLTRSKPASSVFIFV